MIVKGKQKKIGIAIILILLLVSQSVSLLAKKPEIQVFVDGKTVAFDVAPVIMEDRTMVPMRAVFEALGASVHWDQQTRTITSYKGSTTIIMIVGSSVMTVNGEEVSLDASPVALENRTLVPLRAIAEGFECRVIWDGSKRTVTVTSDGSAIVTEPETDPEESKESETLTAVEISKLVSPTVFYIEIYDKNGAALKSGSGFFIDASGIAVTNYHVIENGYSAKIFTVDGEVYEVTGVLSYDVGKDIAVLQLEEGSYPVASLGDSDTILNGEKIYTIGSPRGLENTISEGIISNRSRTLSSYTVPMIQISAPISDGSSGGALINERGEIIGITSAGLADGQNLNFAVPINAVKDINSFSFMTMAEVAEEANAGKTPSPYEQEMTEKEKNDFWSIAQPMENGSTVYGSVNKAKGDYFDYFEVQCDKPGIIWTMLFAEQDADTSKIQLVLAQEGEDQYQGNYVAFGEEKVNTSGHPYIKLSFDVLEPGTYYVVVWQKGNATHDIHYEFYYQYETVS